MLLLRPCGNTHPPCFWMPCSFARQRTSNLVPTIHLCVCKTGRFLLHPTNPHYMLYTTPDTNGYANMAILPRWATEVGCPLTSAN
jgi:hypothetical protein